ncbi:MAG: hypothetical protein R3Y13_05930 [bacterium]
MHFQNFNDKRCGTCEYCSCNREIKKGIFGSRGNVQFKSLNGFCGKTNKSGSSLINSFKCSKYKMWAAIELELNYIERKKQEKRDKLEANRQIAENLRMKDELEKEKKYIEEQEMQRRYDDWFNTLSLEEQYKEKERTKKEEEEILTRFESVLNGFENRQKIKHKKKIQNYLVFLKIFFVMHLIFSLIFGGLFSFCLFLAVAFGSEYLFEIFTLWVVTVGLIGAISVFLIKMYKKLNLEHKGV